MLSSQKACQSERVSFSNGKLERERPHFFFSQHILPYPKKKQMNNSYKNKGFCCILATKIMIFYESSKQLFWSLFCLYSSAELTGRRFLAFIFCSSILHSIKLQYDVRNCIRIFNFGIEMSYTLVACVRLMLLSNKEPLCCFLSSVPPIQNVWNCMYSR